MLAIRTRTPHARTASPGARTRGAAARAIGIAWLAATLCAHGYPASTWAQASRPPEEKAAIFSALRPGLRVSITRLPAGGIEISLYEDGALGTHTVVEAGAHHVMLEDLPGVTRTWIPVTAIERVVHVRPSAFRAPR